MPKTYKLRSLGTLPFVIALVLFLIGVQTASAAVVISQVYGGGGSSVSTASYRNDYIELFNSGSASVDLNGWSVQYASSTGSSWQVTPLSGTIVPGGYFLVQEGGGTTNGAVLPSPDATGTIMMGGSNGKVALSSSTTALSGANPTGTAVIDRVGYGTANGFEIAATAALSINTAAVRNDGGCTDTNNNSLDFTVTAPSPRNSAAPVHSCSQPTTIILHFTTQPAGAVSGTPFNTQPVITAKNLEGSVLTTFNSPVTLTIKPGTGPTGAALAGTTTVTAVDGVATFADIGLNRVGTGYILTTSSDNAVSADSSVFDVAPGPAVSLAFSTQPVGGTAGLALSTQPVVKALDAGGDTAVSFTGSVTLALNGTAVLGGTTTVDVVGGSATFTDLVVDAPGTGFTLTASAAGLTGATSAPFDIRSSDAPASLAFSVQPGPGTAGGFLQLQPVVLVLNSTGGQTTYDGTVSLSIKPATGTDGAILTGTTTVNAVDGAAAFSGVGIDRAGDGYVLTASAAGLTAESAPFPITSAPPAYAYTITDLGVLPAAETGTEAFDVNNRGQVAGWSGQPFLYSGSGLVSLNADMKPSILSYSPARSVNDNGVVVGSFNKWVKVATVSNGDFNAYSAVHAFKWANGTFTDLTPAATTGTQAVAVNAGGDIAIAGLSSYLLLANGTTVGLNGLVTGSTLTPFDLNDSGQVAGEAVNASMYTRAVLWESGTALDLGTLPGDSNSTARAVNNGGQVVGASYGATSTATNTRAFVWQPGGMVALPSRTAAESSVAVGINAYSQVVGYSGSDTATLDASGALMWDTGAVNDLQTLIPSGNGWQLIASRAVNDLGQITGIGWLNNTLRAYLLTPTAVFGDANHDALVSAADAVMVTAMAAGISPSNNLMFLDVAPSPSPAPRGFGDGRLDMLDAVRILRKSTSLEPQWP